MPTGSINDPVEVRARIIGASGTAANEGLATVDIVHERVHDGEMFVASVRFEDVANGGSFAMLIRTGGKDVHMAIALQAGGEAFFDVYEGTSPTANGTQLTAFNAFRRHTNTALTTVYHTPTVGGGNEGTAIFRGFAPGGSGPNAGGGSIRRNTEWIFKPATVYYILITNDSGQTHDYGLAVEFYEHDET